MYLPFLNLQAVRPVAQEFTIIFASPQAAEPNGHNLDTTLAQAWLRVGWCSEHEFWKKNTQDLSAIIKYMYIITVYI